MHRSGPGGGLPAASSAALSATAEPALVLLTHEFAPFRGGAATYVQELAQAASCLGIAVEVLTSDFGTRLSPAAREPVFFTDSRPAFRVVRFPCAGRLTPWGIGHFAWGMFRRRRQLEAAPSILLSVGAHMAAILLHAAGALKAGTFTCFFHGSELLRLARHPLWRPLARRFYAQARGAAVASHYVEQLARSSGLLPAQMPICVAPCAVPTVLAQAKAPDPAAEPASETIRILTVGRLHPRKGQREVALALAALPAELRSRVVFTVVGVGAASYRREVEAACQAGGINVRFAGDVSDQDLPVTYCACDIYVQGSHAVGTSVEGFGISLLEAQFFGRPVVCFRTGGVAEAVQDGVAGLLAAEGDIHALSKAVERLMRDPALRQRMGAAGQRFAREFSWTNSARALASFAGWHGHAAGTPEPDRQ